MVGRRRCRPCRRYVYAMLRGLLYIMGEGGLAKLCARWHAGIGFRDSWRNSFDWRTTNNHNGLEYFVISSSSSSTSVFVSAGNETYSSFCFFSLRTMTAKAVQFGNKCTESVPRLFCSARPKLTGLFNPRPRVMKKFRAKKGS